ncbi:MAG TPA: alpha/beta hydrolase [Solirubrobacterales bacterium]|jgi:pimeloyl-ACP methyl ester carboxylesterase|nr:alpha/beta hydrolase [Solirubrobacterales bacterium]
MRQAAQTSFIVGPEPALHGERDGSGPPIVLCHGITASRGYVVHGSRALERDGYQVLGYDARGHGESDPAPPGQGYGYPQLIDDLERVVGEELGEERFLLAGHSMGAHTAVGYALRHPGRIAGLVIIGPVYTGEIVPRALEYWDGLAAALEEGGVDGFVAFIGAQQGIDPSWRQTVLRFTRARMELHRHLGALSQALREVPRSRPFGTLADLGALDVPVLVVASHDAADPGHPYAAARAYAEALPQARLVSEAEGESPLAWQGGKLSREIAAFAAEPAVARTLGAAGGDRSKSLSS